jgi:cob(I)alamin adenosyltransferase
LHANPGSERSETPSMLAVHGSTAPGETRGRSHYEDDNISDAKIEKLEKKLRRRDKRIVKLENFIVEQGFDVPS